MTDRTAPNAAGTELPPGFEDQQASWHKAVAGVFARVRKQDIADVPLDVWKNLIKTTYDGVDVRPLYTRADDLAEAPAPGLFPFTRGTRLQDVDHAGWGVVETFGREGSGDAREANEAVLNALANGTTAVNLDLRGDLGPDDVATVLKGVLPELAPISLQAGSRLPEALEALNGYLEEAGVEKPENLEIELSAAPLTSLYTGADDVSLEQAVEMAVDAAKRPGTIRTFLVDGVAFANMGATDSQEIGLSLAVGVAYLRAMTGAGLSVEEALNQISFRYSATDDQFNTIAKFRAARELWARVAEVAGAPGLGSAPNHAVTAPVMYSQRDPWVNMLRATVAAFGAGVGGATTVEVLPFDAAIKGGQPGVSRRFATRIARNTNLLLLEESHLGFVADPAGGSYYVEDLTDQLAEKAWKVFTDVEAYGGIETAADRVREDIDAAYERRRTDIAHRRTKVTAINEFPNLADPPLPKEAREPVERVRRWAADFEALRNRSDDFLADKGDRPQVALLPLGPLAQHNVRTGFTANLMASGGIEVINPGQVSPGDEAFAKAAQAAPIVVLCGTDKEYAATGADAVRAAREAGASEILVAGPEKAFADVDADARPDGYLTMNIDAVAELSRLLDSLGA